MLRIPILVILRHLEQCHLAPLTQVLRRAAIDTVEITLNTANAPQLIAELRALAGSELTVGAGTVLTTAQLQSALDAGAEFIVTPVVNTAVIRACTHQSLPVLPGALTPTEVWQAWELGATLVKVFPAATVGPDYFRALRGPFTDIKLMAVGGINAGNLRDYFIAGANAIAVGSSIVSRARLASEAYETIENDLHQLVSQL